MFNWLKKKQSPSHVTFEALGGRLIEAKAIAVALAEAVRDFQEDVNAGRTQCPAHKRQNDSVVSTWRDLRLEALSYMFTFGSSDPMLLADPFQQLALLRCLVDENLHLQIPQPRGEAIADTVQAVWQVYLYLEQVGSDVLDRETDPEALKIQNRSIFDNLIARAGQLRVEWEEFTAIVKRRNIHKGTKLPEMPKTLIEEVYADVTGKTKSIALSAQLGPMYDATFRYMEQIVGEKGGDTAKIRASIDRVLKASDPDELS